MKRILSIIFSLVLLVSTCAFGLSASAADTVTFTGPTIATKGGTLEVVLNSTGSYVGASGTLTYDSSILTLKSITSDISGCTLASNDGKFVTYMNNSGTYLKGKVIIAKFTVSSSVEDLADVKVTVNVDFSNGKTDTNKKLTYRSSHSTHTYKNHYCKCGLIEPGYKGMAKVDTVWAYVKDGKIDTTYTGLSKNSYGYRYIKSGYFAETTTGLLKMPSTSDYRSSEWLYIEKGKFTQEFTGMAKNSYGWRYVKNSVFDPTYTGLSKNEYGIRYIVDGKFASDVSGLLKMPSTSDFYPSKWVYISEGKFDEKFTGMAKNNYGWRYVKNGLYDETYTGLSKNEYGYRYIVKGKFADTKTGLLFMPADSDYYASTWIYIESGKFTGKWTGIASNSYGKRYVKNSVFASTFTGKVIAGGKTYNIKNGKVI